MQKELRHFSQRPNVFQSLWLVIAGATQQECLHSVNHRSRQRAVYSAVGASDWAARYRAMLERALMQLLEKLGYQ